MRFDGGLGGLDAQRHEGVVEIVEAAGKQVGVHRRQLEARVAQVGGAVERRHVVLPLGAEPLFDVAGIVEELALELEQGAGERGGEVRNHGLDVSREGAAARRAGSRCFGRNVTPRAPRAVCTPPAERDTASRASALPQASPRRPSDRRPHRQAVLVLDRLHHHVGVGLLHAGQAGDLLAHHAAVLVDVARTHLEQVVEVASNHQARTRSGDPSHGVVEAAQILLGGAGEQDPGRATDACSAPTASGSSAAW